MTPNQEVFGDAHEGNPSERKVWLHKLEEGKKINDVMLKRKTREIRGPKKKVRKIKRCLF